MEKYIPSSVKCMLITVAINFCATTFLNAQATKVSLSGYTEDLIADSGLNLSPSSVTSTSNDLPTDSGYILFVKGYSSGAVPFTGGLPANGQFTDSVGHNFQFAPYNSNNALRLIALQSGTLSFADADQTSYDTLFILATSGSGWININYTINFTDKSTASGTFIIYDWLNNIPFYAIRNLSRVSRIDGSLDRANMSRFVIREYPIVIPTGDKMKSINSITFSLPGGETGVANIFGITGYANASVTLDYFNASLQNGKILLQWKTLKEFNNKQFIIERSTGADPSSFIVIGEIKASLSGNGSSYQFYDGPNAWGSYQYRLSQEDVDGNKKILATKDITFTGRAWTIQDLGSQWRLVCEQPCTYRLLDLGGRVLKIDTGSGSLIIPKPAAQGLYQIQVQTGGQFSTRRIHK